MENIFSKIRFEKLPKMKIAKHTIISANPEDDIFRYMEDWVKESGLIDLTNYTSRKFGWNEDEIDNPDFRGYTLCVTMPEDFTPKRSDVEILHMEADEYAVLRIIDPFADPEMRIGGGWQKIYDYVQNSEYKTEIWDNRYAFEEIGEIDGVTYMDIYVPIK